MIKAKLTHPDVLAAVAMAGHGAHVVIADGHYPVSVAKGPHAQVVYLNLSPGIVKVTEVLTALVGVVEIEAAAVMSPDEGPEPEIFGEFRRMLGPEMLLEKLRRGEFYERARSDETALVVATGDTRTYANLLLTMGVAEI